MGGYLHTVHSPASKSKTHNQKFQNSNFYRQFSAQNQATVSGGTPIWNKKFFTQGSNDETGQMPLLDEKNNMNSANESNVSEKVNYSRTC